MKIWKVVGYIFVCLGTIFFLYGFFVGFMDTVNPSTIFLGGSSDPSMDAFFGVFWSAIAPWMVLSTVMFIVGGIGLYAGRTQKTAKLANDPETLNSKLDELEKTVSRNYEDLSNRLDAIEKRPQPATTSND
jgi:hypothetical protein